MNIMNKAKIDDKMVDVISFDEFKKNFNRYQPNYTGIIHGDLIYPIRNKTDDRPGLYSDGTLSRFIPPSEDDRSDYSIDNMVRFDDKENMKQIIEAQNQVKDMERAILTTVDNLFAPNLSDNDSPEMRALKQAVINKGIDIHKYEQRFGDSFNNDIRLFNGTSITLGKLKSIGGALDIKGTLILEDASPDVPNPIGKPIVVKLMGGGNE